jgi:scyllo-inositol 2-dehydrogenase (NADP+)
MKIKLGFIGLGRMGITHLSILNSNPDVNITSASDPSKVINILFKKYFDNISLYSDHKELINKEKPDAIVVSTPPNLHYEIVSEAVENKIHVFVEKPFTLSYKESSELSGLAEERGIINQVGYVNRFNDMFLKTKELIENKVIGNVTGFKSEMFSYTISKEDAAEGWRGSEESGGGCLNEMASHAVDLVNYIIGVPDMVSESVLSKILSKNVDDVVSSTFVYNNGVKGTLYVNWCDPAYRKPTNKLEISGTDGQLFVDQHGLKIFLKRANEMYNLKEGWNTIFITDAFSNVPFYVRGNEFTRQLYHFIESLNGNDTKKVCTFRDAAETQKVLNMIRKDSKKGEFYNAKN